MRTSKRSLRRGQLRGGGREALLADNVENTDVAGTGPLKTCKVVAV